MITININTVTTIIMLFLSVPGLLEVLGLGQFCALLLHPRCLAHQCRYVVVTTTTTIMIMMTIVMIMIMIMIRLL